MKSVEVKVLNPDALKDASKMLVFCARLTQRGHNIKNMNDLTALYNKSYKEETFKNMCNLSHNTIKRFGVINIAIVGASRRFLAQITRHQAGLTFMSGSLQYSNYSNDADFCVPYELTCKGQEEVDKYINNCKKEMDNYKDIVNQGIDHDAAGYLAPQGLRNILIISGNPLSFIQMLRTRTCSRNTKETQYVCLKIWEELYKLDPILFGDCGPRCCHEGNFTCGKSIVGQKPSELIKKLYPLLGDKNEN